MNPQRLSTFAEHYAVAILRAEVDLNAHTAPQTPQDHALATTLNLLDTIQSHGVAAVEHYVVNARGGAFRHTCEALGLPCTTRALQDYLDGGTP